MLKELSVLLPLFVSLPNINLSTFLACFFERSSFCKIKTMIGSFVLDQFLRVLNFFWFLTAFIYIFVGCFEKKKNQMLKSD